MNFSEKMAANALEDFLKSHEFILMEGAIVERVRRNSDIELHPLLANAPLIYNDTGRALLNTIYQSYLAIACAAALPFFMCTPSWRANRERVEISGINRNINRDLAAFMKDLRSRQQASFQHLVRIGGLLGCKGDCYRPEEALSCKEAESFHQWQADELAAGAVDFLIAQTLPEMNESLGLARAMANTGLPYFVSFVINREGRMLDGNTLETAISEIDGSTTIPPLGYFINCAYPTFLCADHQPESVIKRISGFIANASSLDHCDLDDSSDLKMEPVDNWTREMHHLKQNYGVKILGGCCGTDSDHLTALTRRIV